MTDDQKHTSGFSTKIYILQHVWNRFLQKHDNVSAKRSQGDEESLGLTWDGLQGTTGRVKQVGTGRECRQSGGGGATGASAGCQAGRHAGAHTGSKWVNHCKHRQMVLCKDTNEMSRSTCTDNNSMTLRRSAGQLLVRKQKNKVDISPKCLLAYNDSSRQNCKLPITQGWEQMHLESVSSNELFCKKQFSKAGIRQ